MGLRNNDLVRIGVYNEIGIMGYHYYLASLSGVPKEGNQVLVDGPGIEILLRLVNHKGATIQLIQRKIKRQEDDPPSAR